MLDCLPFFDSFKFFLKNFASWLYTNQCCTLLMITVHKIWIAEIFFADLNLLFGISFQLIISWKYEFLCCCIYNNRTHFVLTAVLPLLTFLSWMWIGMKRICGQRSQNFWMGDPLWCLHWLANGLVVLWWMTACGNTHSYEIFRFLILEKWDSNGSNFMPQLLVFVKLFKSSIHLLIPRDKN